MTRRRVITVFVLLLALVLMTQQRHAAHEPFLGKRAIAEVPHHGFRTDIPDARRGNATFYKAVFTREGNYLVTFGPGFRIWNPRTGELLRTIPGQLDGNDLVCVDGTHHRLLARRGDIAPTMPEAFGLGIWDLRDGSRLATIPETDRQPTFPIGFTGDGDAVVFRQRNVEVWRADGGGVRVTVPPPEGTRFCEQGLGTGATYNDKQCFELSPSGRWLAVTVRDTGDNAAVASPLLVDLQRGAWTPMWVPEDVGRHGIHAFAFSNDERTLALSTSEGLWIWGPSQPGIQSDDRRGPFIPGEHKRGQFLIPMAFTANDSRIVALGDQAQVSTFDVATGTLVGRVSPPFEDLEGTLRVSADGSRALAYRFLADILVVIDGATGTQRGYLCPYFCNRMHNPVDVPYAVSADGRMVASGGRLGAGIWDTDADTLIAPLQDPKLPPLKPR